MTQQTATTCPSCGSVFSATPTKTFFTLKRFKCSECGVQFLQPLSSKARMVYRVLAVWMAIASVYIISQGAIPIPGLLGVLAVGALSQDASARKAMQATRA